jgi:hypothetical protein
MSDTFTFVLTIFHEFVSNGAMGYAFVFILALGVPLVIIVWRLSNAKGVVISANYRPDDFRPCRNSFEIRRLAKVIQARRKLRK